MDGFAKSVRQLLVALVLFCAQPAWAETTTYIVTDAQGTVVAHVDRAGHVTYEAAYRPYGRQGVGVPQAGPGYTGHVNDPDTGLVYMQQRYYDPDGGRFLSVDPIAPSSGNVFNFGRYTYANNNPYKFTDPDGRCPQCLWGAPIGAVVNIGVQMAMSKGSVSERFSQISWKQVGVATVTGALSGGVSAVASTAATATGAIAANVIGNAAVGAVATQASAQVDGRTASISEVTKGASLSGGTAALGAAISSAPGVVRSASSAGMTQTERTATANLLEGIKKTTPDFKYTDPVQTTANVAGSAVSSSGDLKPLLDKKKE